VIPVAEETARIEKRAIETGRVRVGTHTDTVEQVLRETLRSEAVSVTRVRSTEPSRVARGSSRTPSNGWGGSLPGKEMRHE
jgi:stress response protein YsnF